MERHTVRRAPEMIVANGLGMRDDDLDKGAIDEVPDEYDFGKRGAGVRGKDDRRFRARTHLVRLAPGDRFSFPTDESLNEAFRSLTKS